MVTSGCLASIRVGIIRAVAARLSLPSVRSFAVRAGRQRGHRRGVELVAAIRAAVRAGGHIATNGCRFRHERPPSDRRWVTTAVPLCGNNEPRLGANGTAVMDLAPGRDQDRRPPVARRSDPPLPQPRHVGVLEPSGDIPASAGKRAPSTLRTTPMTSDRQSRLKHYLQASRRRDHASALLARARHRVGAARCRRHRRHV